MRLLRALFRKDEGQDLVEYTLLIAFIALVSAGILLGMSDSVSGIWSTSNVTLASANKTATGASPTQSTGGGDGHGDGHGDGGH